MPELPEVETVRRELLISVQNKKIEHVVLLRQKNIKAEPRAFIEALEGTMIIDVNRKGKCLRFDLDNGYSFYSHLRMEGKYFLSHQGDSYDKFDLLVIDFTDGTSLRYNDVRKFGTFHLGLTKDAEVNGPFSEIGPEPFDLSGKELKEAFSKRNIPVKVALLDQPIISGIGNIYDSEILFASKIDPMTKACDLSLAQCDTIIEEARRILNRAIEAGGTTIKSFHHGDNIDGMFQLELQVYGKEGEPIIARFAKDKRTPSSFLASPAPSMRANPRRPLISKNMAISTSMPTSLPVRYMNGSPAKRRLPLC